jgi:AcrR family transcriptional regulator
VKKKSIPSSTAKKKPRQKRTYESPARQRQAGETRSRIATAARLLLTRNGYAGMTIPAVAAAAGVAVPTVYAIFGSKKGIVAELLDQARFGDDYHALVNEVQKVTAPLERLSFVSRIARRVYESEVPVEEERDCQRYDRQLLVIDALHKAKLFRPGLTRDAARDILWCLTSRDLYRMLIRDRNWTPQQYESWLNEALRRELVKTT